MDKKLIKFARSNGWEVTRTRNGHFRWLSPNKEIPQIISSSTPSCSRAHKNLVADLRRGGLVI